MERKPGKLFCFFSCAFLMLSSGNCTQYFPLQNPRADPHLGGWWVSLCKTAPLNFVARVDDFFQVDDRVVLGKPSPCTPQSTSQRQSGSKPPTPAFLLPLNRLRSILTNVLKDFFQEQTPPVCIFCFCKLYCVPHKVDITKW